MDVHAGYWAPARIGRWWSGVVVGDPRRTTVPYGAYTP